MPSPAARCRVHARCWAPVPGGGSNNSKVRSCALAVVCIGMMPFAQAFPARAHRTAQHAAALLAAKGKNATAPMRVGNTSSRARGRRDVSTAVPAGVSCAILQTGLLSFWIVESTLDMVVTANPQLPFRFVGLFQTTGVVWRRWNEALTAETKGLNATSPTLAALDKGWRAMRAVPNLEVDFLGVTHNPPAQKLKEEFKGRTLTFDNDYRQLNILVAGAKFVSPKATHLLRLREDAGWYAPFLLPLVSSTILYKDCFGYTGMNDKMWFGPAKHVLELQRLYFEVFLSARGRTKSTEDALVYAANQLKRAGVRKWLVDFPASDARMQAGRVCWKFQYLCGARSAIDVDDATRHGPQTLPPKSNVTKCKQGAHNRSRGWRWMQPGVDWSRIVIPYD